MQLPAAPKASTINASVLYGPRDLRMTREKRSIEDPGLGELQIAVHTTGICGSDVSYYKKFANGDLCACMPLSLGHESSGTVVAIGPQVSGFSIGDRVALEVGIPCGQCGICRQGRYNLCKRMRFRSSAKSVPHFQGTLQDRINHPAVWCHKLPDNISFDAAALLEPLSVAIHAVNRAQPTPGSSALVLGAGAVGLLTAAMARQSGCSTVTIADVDRGRVDFALAKGFATHGYVVPPSSSTSSSSSSLYTPAPAPPALPPPLRPSQHPLLPSPTRLRQIPRRGNARCLLALPNNPMFFPDDDEEADGVNTTFECTGKEICTHTALYATRAGGKVILVGMGTPVQTLSLSVAHLREIDILGIFRDMGNGMGAGAGFVLPKLDDMVTHRFKGLENAGRAFELASRTVDGEGGLVVKVVIEA
ncbi:hypothetical protein N0V88_005018 [Collariella sp. IMI 366227]|nr:hypothetical protein N0V88_005018 [Collariella sp. IMI 366227]